MKFGYHKQDKHMNAPFVCRFDLGDILHVKVGAHYTSENIWLANGGNIRSETQPYLGALQCFLVILTSGISLF